MFTKKIMAAAAVAVASLGITSSAQAFTNAPVGSTVVATNTTPISLSTFSSCNNSTLSGPVTVDNGPGNGGVGSITSASFTNCTAAGMSMTVTSLDLPWTLSVNGAGNASIIRPKVRLQTSSFTCEYQAPTTGLTGNYNNSTGVGTVSGTMTRTSASGWASFLCPSSSTVQGSWQFRVGSSSGPILVL